MSDYWCAVCHLPIVGDDIDERHTTDDGEDCHAACCPECHSAIICPYCGAEMRQTRGGATLRKRGPAYVCPKDEAATRTDAAGRMYRDSALANQHGPFVIVWEGDSLTTLTEMQ
ncbi:MAG: hypothetical protein MUC79_15420 [Thiobacillaceae bacterium]|nr:hypothetical protein [Thiobacillaceae bacterium]